MKTLLTTLAVVGAPRAALACPVCFGQSDSPMAAAMNVGIWVMLGVVVSVLAAFASFFIYLMRRAKIAQQQAAQTAHHIGGQEGTAQC